MPADNLPPRDWMSDAVIIAAIPLMGHLAAFLYEIGFSRTFGIPYQLISLSLTTVLLAAGVLVSLALALFLLANGISVVIPDMPEALRAKVMRAAPAVALLVAYLVLFGLAWREWIAIAIGVALLMVLDFSPLLGRGAAYIAKLEADETAARPMRERALISRIGYRIGATPVTLGIWTLYVGSVALAAGHAEALRQQEFLVVPTSPEMVVLRIYGEILIATPVDRAAKTVRRRFVILKIDSDPSRLLSLERVGPLRSLP